MATGRHHRRRDQTLLPPSNECCTVYAYGLRGDACSNELAGHTATMQYKCNGHLRWTTLVHERIECNDYSMHTNAYTLAVLLRQAQWSLDDAAFDVGAGRSTREQRQALADELAHLADVLRAADDAPLVIDLDE